MNAKLTRQEFASILANALPDSALLEINNVPDGSIPMCTGRTRASTGSTGRASCPVMTIRDLPPQLPITRAEVAAILVRMADPNSRILFDLG